MHSAHCQFSHFAGKRIHLGVCGSVAAYKAADLLRAWQKSGLGVSVTMSEGAQKFVMPLTFEALGASPLYTEMFNAQAPFGHLEPGQTAQVMVIAPATAATMAHLAQGQADSILACQALAFDGPLVIAPAMNPRMWAHPATQANVALLQARGAIVVSPGVGGTACGDEGQGRLADIRHIWLEALRALSPQDMAGKRVLVTLGPTREGWDAVRYWSNPSTGVMGASLAMAAYLRGAEVYAVCGPCTGGIPWLPPAVHTVEVVSARQMFDAAESLWPQMDMGIFCAAVADFSPEPYGKDKFKKDTAAQGFAVQFTPNTDILKTLAARRNTQKILGFAAETTDNLPQAVREKLHAKGADILAGNALGTEGAGFGAPTNVLCVADRFGREESWPKLGKPDAAWRLCSWLLAI